jgi:Xaa-Pro aminopeptidase
MAERLAAYGLDRAGARIGVARLSGSRFETNGLASATYLDALKAALPNVQFVAVDQWGADSGPVEESAMLKGAEEHATVRRAVAASERGLAAMVQSLRAGARRQADAWFTGYADMFAATGEDPTRLSIALDRPANSTLGEPVDDPIREGQIVNEEIDATVQGYRAQVNHAVFVGGRATPGYDYYRTALEAAAKIVGDCVSTIVPGKTTCGDLVDRYIAQLADIGAEDTAGVILHSSGIGNLTRPRLGPGNSTKDFEIVLRPGMTFDFKAQFHLKRERIADVGPRNRDVQIGEHFLVTATGVERLGARELAPLTTR